VLNQAMHNERELLLLLTGGDENAFEEIYHMYSHRIYGNLIKLVKSEALAQELLQDTFIKVWEHKHSIDPEQSFRAYLFSIAQNLVYDFYRKAARDKQLRQELLTTAAIFYEHIEETLLGDTNEALLQKAIENLPPQRRQVFILCKLEGKSYNEVSSLLGISTSTISDHIVKATRHIKEIIAKENRKKIQPEQLGEKSFICIAVLIAFNML
jgi:RNA polymerase sigma-70 factor (family 1)